MTQFIDKLGDIGFYAKYAENDIKGRPIVNTLNKLILDANGIPNDMDFIYFANDYIVGQGIPNVIKTSDMGLYNQNETYNLTKNGSGSNCYLSNGNEKHTYLKQDLTNERLTAMKAENSTYSYYLRVYNDTATGGIISWRKNASNYVYMFRCSSNNIQIHSTSFGYTAVLYDGDVYKIEVNGVNTKTTNLDKNTYTTYTISDTRTMGNTMYSFNAHPTSTATDYEAHLAKFYGLAGIARATTMEEDEAIRKILHRQSL